MPTPILNNGIFMRDRNYEVSSNIDSYHLRNIIGDTKPTDLGVIDIWQMGGKVQMPFYSISAADPSTIIDVDDIDGKFTWKIPVGEDLPYVVADLDPSNTKKGEDGTPFQLFLSKRKWGHGAIISFSNFSGPELEVTDDDIIDTKDGSIFTVRIVNNDVYKTFDNKYLTSKTKFFRKSSARGEYGERFDEIFTSGGYREFFNFVGKAEAHASFSVSSRADMIMKQGMNTDGTIPVTEIWKNFETNQDPSIASLNDLVRAKGADGIKSMVRNGTLTRSFVTSLEAACISKVSNDIENYLVYGQGGRTTQDGPDDIMMTVGLWRQTDRSHKRIFTLKNFSLDMFSSELYNFFKGRVDIKTIEPNNTVIVQTGMGGMKLIGRKIQEMVASSGFMLNGGSGPDGIGAVTKKGMNLGFGFAYTSFIVPFLANVQFVLNSSFDNENSNDIDNPIIDGYRLSSYSFIATDIVDNKNDNIVLLRKKYDNELKWWYQNGTMDYMGRSQGFQSSGNFNGYRVNMSQPHKALFVKDPTRIMKFVMKNPITGGTL